MSLLKAFGALHSTAEGKSIAEKTKSLNEKSLRDKHILLQIWSGGDISAHLTSAEVREQWERYGEQAGRLPDWWYDELIASGIKAFTVG